MFWHILLKKINRITPAITISYLVTIAFLSAEFGLSSGFLTLVVMVGLVGGVFVYKTTIGKKLIGCKRSRVKTFFCCLLGIALAILLWINHPVNPNGDQLESVKWLVSAVEVENLEAVILTDPEYKSSHQRFIVETTIAGKDRKIQISTEPYREYHVGDKVLVSGELEPPEDFETEQGKVFHYRNFLASKNISAIISFANIKPVSRSENFFIRQKLDDLKQSFVSSVNRHLPEPYASLGSGITVGVDDALGESYETKFRQVGLTHIVVLSGFNIAIVVIVLSAAVTFLPHWWRVAVSGAGIWLFILLVGASPPVVRAGIMATIAAFTLLYGRALSGLSLLLLALSIMVSINPLVILFNPSFQLSALATFGIIVVTPVISTWLKVIPQTYGLREIVAATLATQIMVLPWILFLMGEVSIVSPIVNALVLPVIPIAMLTLFLMVISSQILLIVGKLFALVSYLLLEYVFIVTELFSDLSFSTISLKTVALLEIGFVYLAISCWLYWSYKRHGISLLETSFNH